MAPSLLPPHTYGPSKVELRNGISMPMLGLGTSHKGGYSHSAVVYALKECGYRLIDTAKRYGNEELLQVAIEESGVLREDLFLTTKLWPADYGTATTKASFHGSLKRLGVEYLDLFLLHWPECPSHCSNKWQTLEDTWRVLEQLYDEGLCRSIGVSNYEIDHLERQLNFCSVVPHVNQVEFHPYQYPSNLHTFCIENKIQLEGYSPLAKGQILHEPPVLSIAKSLGRTPAQVLIRWSIQKGVVAIPKSTKHHRVKANAEVFDFELSQRDLEVLGRLHDGRKVVSSCDIQEKIDSSLPDGYQINVIPTSCV